MKIIAAWSFMTLVLTSGCALGLSSDPTEWSAVEAVDQLCSGKMTATDYASALIDKATEWDCINTFAYFNRTQIMEDAAAVDARNKQGVDTRPLCGLAFVIKDIFDVVGMPTVAGTPAFEGMMPTNTTPLVTKMLQANGVILGKTRPHELSYGGTTINPLYGAVLNPYDVTRHVGGSSGGTGAAISARLTTGGFCSDTGGSCRIPASMNGVAGLRPSFGCYNAADGIVPMTTSRDTAGFMARSVEDIQLFNSILSDCDSQYQVVSLKGLRLGYPVDRWEHLDAEAEFTLQGVVKSLEAAGVVLVPMNLTKVEELNTVINPVVLNIQYEIGRELARHMYVQRKNVSVTALVDQIASPLVKSVLEDAILTPLDTVGRTPKDYAKMLTTGAPTILEMYEDAFAEAGVDFFIGPTTVTPPNPIDGAEPYQAVNGELVGDAMIRHTFLDSSIQCPAVSLSAGLTESGLPIGFQVSGLPGNDAMMLSVAVAIEKVIQPTPAPPKVPGCTGCIAAVGTQTVTYDGTVPLKAEDTWSVYTLSFSGENCSHALTNRSPPEVPHLHPANARERPELGKWLKWEL